MPLLGKGTECIKLLLSQVSNNMQEPMVPMFFPVLGAHISGAEFQYPDNSWKEMTGMMANLVAKSGDNKGQFPPLVEAICRDFRQHDKAEPTLAYWFPPIDTTKAAFIKNAIALEMQEAQGNTCRLPGTTRADSGGSKKRRKN